MFNEKRQLQNTKHWEHGYALHSRGFTLVESLIVFAVVGILSGIMFTKFQYTEQSAQLDFDTDTLVGSLYEARAFSLAGQRVGPTRPNGGYGVRMETCANPPCSYFLFADTDPAQPNPSDHMYTAGGSDAIVKTVPLSSKVIVNSITPSNPTSITFSIPNGTVYVNGTLAINDVIIELRHVGSGSTKQVSINPSSGRINIE